MTPRPKRKLDWRKSRNGTWSCSIGQNGDQIVRLFENSKSHVFYRDVRSPDGRRNRCTLRTTDRDEAGRLGWDLYVRLNAGSSAAMAPTVVSATSDAPMRLADVCERFIAECPAFLDNRPRGRQDDIARLQVVVAGLGGHRNVRTLKPTDMIQYAAKRKLGGIVYSANRVTRPVRERSVEADIKLLKQVLSWACTVVTETGEPWLSRNPLEYYTPSKESDVLRPVASFDRFLATQEAMRSKQQQYRSEVDSASSPGLCRLAKSRYQTWVRAELALVLLEATGRRRGAIMGLQWEDIDWRTRKITWHAKYDKKKRTKVVIYPADLIERLRSFQVALETFNGFLFPSETDPSRPASRELLSEWILKAERAAGLPKLPGGVTHPYRRKWRSERNKHPIKAVADAGGWSDYKTMTTCYDFPEDADILAVTSEPRKRRDHPESEHVA